MNEVHGCQIFEEDLFLIGIINADNIISKIESQTQSKFVKRSSSGNNQYYFCKHNKAYHSHKNKIDLQREPKQNKTKLEFSCPSFIKVAKKLNGLFVKWAIYHPHENQAYYSTLNDEIKNEIYQKLIIGLPEATILKKIRIEYPEFIIGMQDIYNVKNKRIIDPGLLDPSDKISCMKHAEQNRSIEIIDFCESICICISTEFQRELLAKNSMESCIFGLDSTHCTNSYGFFLTTLHLILPNHQGIPVGHMISTNEKEQMIDKFLLYMKPFIGLSKHTLITDDYQGYVNSWIGVIGEVFYTQCLWHIKKNWRLNLAKNKITGNIKKLFCRFTKISLNYY